ncbi:hypothetical protein [Vibrio alfacsensis]|uniref:hypothetical protein n=1 Tax=Vibrio alfacsensis TaxID=1074311 RepID=UPI001BF010AD|nr:hypothetical protein [Vibrio alfacsensis]BCN23313.1 hypothetical protein VYA_05050 [Vibrio alfacsensis]
MGFWDTVGKAASTIGKEVVKQGGDALERSKQYREQCEDMSDDQLVSVIKRERSRTPLKAGAASGELKRRGYDQDTITFMVQNS